MTNFTDSIPPDMKIDIFLRLPVKSILRCLLQFLVLFSKPRSKQVRTKMANFIDSISLDMKIEIFLRLPVKSILRCRSVSKSWCSIISSQQFIEAFMSKSLSRPHLVLPFKNPYKDNRLFLFSSPPQSCSFLSSSSLLVAPKSTLTMPKGNPSCPIYVINSIRGFVCCLLRGWFVICNPTTGQVIQLGKKKNDDCMYLGYDPNSDQYKVLRLERPNSFQSDIEHSVLTLGGQKSTHHSWRPIKSSILYYRCCLDCVCIDGVVYYKYEKNHKTELSSFDVGSEQLSLIETPEDLSGKLTNYLGKLAVHDSVDEGFILWVFDDVKNQVWSKKTYKVFPSFTHGPIKWRLKFSGITAFGEIVYVRPRPKPFWRYDDELFCYDMEKKMERIVKVKRLVGVECVPCYYSSSILCSYVDNILFL